MFDVTLDKNGREYFRNATTNFLDLVMNVKRYENSGEFEYDTGVAVADDVVASYRLISFSMFSYSGSNFLFFFLECKEASASERKRTHEQEYVPCIIIPSHCVTWYGTASFWATVLLCALSFSVVELNRGDCLWTHNRLIADTVECLLWFVFKTTFQSLMSLFLGWNPPFSDHARQFENLLFVPCHLWHHISFLILIKNLCFYQLWNCYHLQIKVSFFGRLWDCWNHTRRAVSVMHEWVLLVRLCIFKTAGWSWENIAFVTLNRGTRLLLSSVGNFEFLS